MNSFKKRTILFVEPVGIEYNIVTGDIVRAEFISDEKKNKEKFELNVIFSPDYCEDEDLLTIWDNEFNIKIFINDELEYSSLDYQ